MELAQSSNSRNGFVFFALVFKIMMDYSYFILSTSYLSGEYVLDINWLKVIISYIIVFAVSWLPIKSNKESAFLFKLIIFFTIIPIASVYCMRNESSVYFLLVMISFLIVEWLLFTSNIQWMFGGKPITYSKAESNPIHIRRQNQLMSKLVKSFCIIFALLTIALMYSHNGRPRLDTFILNNVYDVRESYVTTKYLGYMTSLITYVLVPFGIASSINKKNKLPMIFWLLIQLMLFLWTGHKTWLFSIILLVAMVMFTKNIITENFIFGGLVGLSAIACATAKSSVYVLTYIFSFFNRRVLLNAATLKYFYYDYFAVRNNKLIGTSGTILAPFFSHQGVDENYATTISKIYTGIVSNANTGIYGGDFANIGLAVFIITPILLLFFAFLVMQSSKNCGRSFTIILFSYLAFSFNDQAILQYFLDFKGLALILLIMCYRYMVDANVNNTLIDKNDRRILVKRKGVQYYG